MREKLAKTVFVTKGSGEKKRSQNIEAVRKLILKGLSYEEIWSQACLYISTRTFDEYYRIASQSIMRENKNEQ